MTNEREIALFERFDQSYAVRRQSAMRTVERSVCGCSYGASSWTDRPQADAMIAELGLGPGKKVMDIGAGSGWPGLYFAEVSGCDVVLVDLPEEGLNLAREQAEERGIADRVETIRADAATLDLPPGSVPLITHSDVLCCLPGKRAVLEVCRRLIAPQGRMLFTVIYLAEKLSPEEQARAEAYSPEFVVSGQSYPELLRDTGWKIERSEDLTPQLERSFADQIAAEQASREALAEVMGEAARKERLDGFIGKHAAIRDRLVRRAIYRVAPVAA